jgi:hypothetical protein
MVGPRLRVLLTPPLTVARRTNPEHNTAFSVVDRLCVKRDHFVYTDRLFSSPKIFDHLWGFKTRLLAVMSNRKEVPKQEFSGELKKGRKISRQRDHLLVNQWKDIRDVFFLTTAHEDVLVEAPSSKGHIIK